MKAILDFEIQYLAKRLFCSEIRVAIDQLSKMNSTNHVLVREDLSAITFYTNTQTANQAYDLVDLYRIYQLSLQNQYLAQKESASNILNVKNNSKLYTLTLFHEQLGSSPDESAINPNPIYNSKDAFPDMVSPISVVTPKWGFDLFPQNRREITYEEYAYELSLVGVLAELNEGHSYTLTMSQNTHEELKDKFYNEIVEILDRYCESYEKFNFSYDISDDLTEITLLFENEGEFSGLRDLVEPREILRYAISYRVLEGEKRESAVFFTEKYHGGFGSSHNTLD